LIISLPHFSANRSSDSPLVDGSESWQDIIAPYQRSDTRRAWIQILNSFLPYGALWVAMVWSLGVSYWITLALALVSAGFLTRIFIILHDCGHGSFFRSRRGNDVLGFLSGILSFTPYHYWRHAHARHHATAGNLNRRGLGGDIWTMTLEEYRSASRWKRIQFRLFRNPFFLFILAPSYLFLIKHRFARPSDGPRWHLSVLWSNLGLFALAAGLSLIIGVRAYLLIQLPVMMMAASIGVWLFYVQHQFEDAYWEDGKDWDYLSAALEGSSYYALPGVFQWLSGNIGFHHVHHLGPRIPNYRLPKCHRENAIFQRVKPLYFLESFKCLRIRVWDAEARRMVGIGSFLL
jgi:omega-6 fatty acid desaturase (delta-12 desaturase)